MRESRITRNIFILVGATVLLLAALIFGWYFVLVRPQKVIYAKAKTDYDAQLVVANQLTQSLADERKAEDRLSYISGQFDFLRKRYRNLYFGNIGSDYAADTLEQKANREAIWRNWMNYYYNGYGPALQKELQDYATANNVHIVSSISLVSPPNKPEDVQPPATGLLKPLAGGGAAASGAAAGGDGGSMSVTVSGSLPDILRYFNSLNNNVTLVKIGTIKLDTEPGPPVRVRATFTLTPYLLSAGPGAVIADSAGGATSTPVTASGPPNAIRASAPNASADSG